MQKRKAISKKTRFEVFKRDAFSCQYCGAKAPDAILHVDHIDPVSKSGSNEIVNLITSCEGCNLGKSDRRLDDQSVLALQRKQLDELSARREQLQLMMQWRKGLKSIKQESTDQAAAYWAEACHGYHLNEKGLAQLSSLVRRFGLSLVLEAMEISAERYLEFSLDEDRATQASVENAWHKVGGICSNKSQPEDEQALRYCRGIIRNRLGYINEAQALVLLRAGMASGATSETLKDVAREARNWTGWRNDMEDLIAAVGGHNG